MEEAALVIQKKFRWSSNLSSHTGTERISEASDQDHIEMGSDDTENDGDEIEKGSEEEEEEEVDRPQLYTLLLVGLFGLGMVLITPFMKCINKAQDGGGGEANFVTQSNPGVPQAAPQAPVPTMPSPPP
jgi:hypothetical protein